MRLPAGRGRGKWFGVLCAVGLTGGCDPGAVEQKPGTEPGENSTPPPPAPVSEPPEETPALKPLSRLRVTRDELLQRGSFPTHHPASLSLRSDGEPEVTYPISDHAGSRAYFARRELDARRGPSWSFEQLPLSHAMPLLQRRADGTPLLLMSDGAFGLSLWTREAWGWHRAEVLGPDGGAWTGSFVSDAQGGLHVVPQPGYQVDYWRKEQVWEKPISYSAGPRKQILSPSLSLSPTGQAHLAFWGADALWWAAPPAQAERVFQGEESSTGRTLLLVTKGGPGGQEQPHLLTRWEQLRYSTREADGWKTRIVADSREQGHCQYADRTAHETSMTCIEDFIRPTPLALVERGGEVVLVYAQHRRKGVSTWSCTYEPSNGFSCDPRTQEWEVDEHLLALATPTADGFDVHSFPFVTEPGGASGQIDTQGRIHLVFYDAAPDQGVRYLMLE